MIDDRKLYSYYVLLYTMYYYSIMSSIIVFYVFSKIMSLATKVLLPKHIIYGLIFQETFMDENCFQVSPNDYF